MNDRSFPDFDFEVGDGRSSRTAAPCPLSTPCPQAACRNQALTWAAVPLNIKSSVSNFQSMLAIISWIAALVEMLIKITRALGATISWSAAFVEMLMKVLSQAPPSHPPHLFR